MTDPLEEAATRFVATHPGAPAGPIEGADGLRRLAEAIDAWAERDEVSSDEVSSDEVSSDEDEAFVEGAGALLGRLLVAHLGGAHVARGEAHRVRLGEHGFFDPFAAVEDALDEGAHTVLSQQVARAEAEARGEAGVGRAMRLLLPRLGARRVARAFGPTVELDDGIELDLSRVLRATEGDAEPAAAQAIDKLVAMLPGRGGEPAIGWDEARERLRPRPTRAGFAADVGAGRAALACRPLFGGALELTFVLAYDGRARYLRADELEGWGRSADDVLGAAVRNLAAASARARFGRIDTAAGPMIVARTGDGLDGARLLLPTLHAVLSEELGSPFLAAVPHRDALLACADTPALSEALAGRAEDDAARAPHAVCSTLFEVSDAGVRRR